MVEIESTTNSNPTESYSLSKYRHINLFVFILSVAANGLPPQAFASISGLVETKFEYSPFIISLNILLGPIIHPIMATPANLILDKFGMKVGISLGSTLVLLGVWARTLMQIGNPAWVTFGSILCSAGNVFALSSTSVFAIKWYESESVPKIIAASVVTNLIASGMGASLAGMFLSPSSTPDDIVKFFRLEAIIITVPILVFLIFFKEKPEHPPSKAAEISLQNANKTKEPYIKTIKQLLVNKSYLKIVLAMSFSYGIFLSFVSLIDQCLSTLNFENPGKMTSTTLASAILIGALASFAFSYAIKVAKRYKYIITLCQIGTIITFGLLSLAFCLEVHSYTAIGILAGCAGFFVIPLTALFTTYSAELTFPTPQGSATGYLFAGSQTIGFISGLIWISLIDKKNKYKIYLLLACHVIFIILSLFVNLSAEENLNKSKYEDELTKERNRESLISNEDI